MRLDLDRKLNLTYASVSYIVLKFDNSAVYYHHDFSECYCSNLIFDSKHFYTRPEPYQLLDIRYIFVVVWNS